MIALPNARPKSSRARPLVSGRPLHVIETRAVHTSRRVDSSCSHVANA